MAELIVLNEKGKYMDDNALGDVLRYILRDSKIRHNWTATCNLEGVTPDEIAAEMEATAIALKKNFGVRLRHFTVSYTRQELTDPQIAYQLGVETLRYYAGEYQGVMAVHEDAEQVHFHLVINAVNLVTGTKYGGKHEEFRQFMRYMTRLHDRYDLDIWDN